MENQSNERIIGNCLEVNADIVKMKFESKGNKFIKSIKEKYFTRKLINSVNKLAKANSPLTRENLIELFSYIYNNFPPNGTYKNITKISHVNKPDFNIWKSVIKYDENTVYTIEIDENEPLFTVVLIENDRNKDSRINRTVYLKELITNNDSMSGYIRDLNILLIGIIKEYILSVIDSSKEIEERKEE